MLVSGTQHRVQRVALLPRFCRPFSTNPSRTLKGRLHASKNQASGGRRALFNSGGSEGGDYAGYSSWEPPMQAQGADAGAGDDWLAVEQGSDLADGWEEEAAPLAPIDWTEEPAGGQQQGEEEDEEGEPRERVFLVGVALKNARKKFGYTIRESLDELGRLSDTAGLRVVGSTHQVLESPNMSTYIGSGKVAEVARAVKALNVDTVVFDDELSPGQLRNLEKAFGGPEAGVRVCDRTALILDIFSQRAQTREGKLQVELAQLEYQLPRLTRMWSHLERQSGGGQVKGMGEKQLEVDKRLLRDRIAALKRDLEHVRTHRRNYRQRRAETPIPVVALVGYTNAGKSTLLNRLTNAGVLAEDKLFATLDPTTRRVRLPGNQEVLVSDTVGFIQKLPTTLVAAFRATLEEVVEAAVLLHVVDVSHANAAAQSDAVMQVLDEIDAGRIPLVTAWNKLDASPHPDRVREVAATRPDTVAISSYTGEGVEDLMGAISSKLAETMVEVDILLPYAAGDLLDAVHKLGTVQAVDYTEHGTSLSALVPHSLAGRLLPYAVAPGAKRAEQAAAAAV